MDKIYYEKMLYRIIQGRLRLPFCDPVLYLYESESSTIEESFEIYDQTYERAYFLGLYIKDELKEILFNNDMWSPNDDKRADEIEEQMDELKVQAFQNYWDKKKLRGFKLTLRRLEKEHLKYRSRINTLDHISCEGVANFVRSLWIVSKSLKDIDGNRVESDGLPITRILDYQQQNVASSSDLRYIARNNPFRSMWTASKGKVDLFGVPACRLTSQQLALCQVSSMYDSVYENPDSPDDKVIEDDDCLDGWFIVKQREYKKAKNQREVEAMIGNSKIANAQDIFVMADSPDKIQKINDMNDPHTKAIIQQRDQQIRESSTIKFQELTDVKQSATLGARQKSIQTIKSR